MDTYGDLVTLLLCFFVLLFAFSSMDAAKWEALVGAFAGTPVMNISVIDPAKAMEKPIETVQKSIGTEKTPPSYENPSPSPDPSPEPSYSPGANATEKDRERFEQLNALVNDFMTTNGLDASIDADFEALVITIRFNEKIFYASGSADLYGEAYPILDKMADMFRETNDFYQLVRIEGHTDNVPINTDRYPDNWYLSMFRSMGVLHYILNTGKVANNKITALGFGEEQPIADNDTAEGRALNRRVDFVIEGIITP